jgi:hypothetical protein
VRLALRIGIALVVLLVVVLGGLVVALPRIASSDAVRARLVAAARDATGREVTWEALSFGLLPPRLVVERPRLGGPAPVEARAVDLRVALLPLLTRTVMVDSLAIEGASVRLVRTKDGIALPGAPEKTLRTPADEKAPSGGPSFAIAVGKLALRDARLALEDRTVTPAVTWEVLDLEASAAGSSLEGPLDVSVAGRLGSGGSVRARGTARLDGRLDLDVTLDDVALAPARPYLGREPIAGMLSGTVAVDGPAATPASLVAKLTLADAKVAVGTVTLGGTVGLDARLAGDLAAPSGTVEVDASAAEVAYGETFTKPAGTAATFSGRLVPGRPGQLGVEDARLRLKNLQGTGRLALGPRTRVELAAPPFDLAGWEALVPALETLGVGGSLALENLAVATVPLDVRGGIGLVGLRVRPSGGEPIRLDGTLEGTGDTIRSKDLRATIAGQTAALDVEVAGLAGAPSWRVAARTEKADANALLTALAGMRDTLHGPLDLTANLSGPLGGRKPPLGAARGQVRLDIGRGRLKGVSLLKDVIDQLGSVGEAALVAGQVAGGRDLQRFYEDEFQSIAGTFALAGGTARTDDLRLVYRHYTVDLRGGLGLLDSRLDLTGQLTIDKEVDTAIAGAGAASPGRAKTIPLAHVRGTLTQPRLDLSPEAVAALASGVALGTQRPKLEREIDKHLGKGSGGAILDTLDGILGGGGGKQPRK